MKYSFGKQYGVANQDTRYIHIHRNEDGRYIGVITIDKDGSTGSFNDPSLIKFSNKKFRDEMEVLDELNKG